MSDETNVESPLDEIWRGDMLRRRDEARLLERYLISETETFAAQGREQALVLALDAQYGEGKSWFLKRFTEQLTLNHPVASVDAWVDDGNNEPLVSIMAALEDCLRPHLRTAALKKRMASLARAALPIMGKAAVAAAGKAMEKYLGDTFGEEASATLQKAKAATAKKADDDTPADAALDALAEGVSEIVDVAGKAMLAQYRERQKSRDTFKANLKAIAQGLRAAQGGGKQGPIFIVVDELDRCRPSYAISLLEDIKHLFDVPGVVFIIALHSGQLQASVKAIYGEHFDGADYLRRFFTRHYELRRLLITELVASQFTWIDRQSVRLESPSIYGPQGHREADPVELTGLLLSEWRATPREALSILDGLRLFIAAWDHPVPIELPLVLGILYNFVRGEGAHSGSPPQRVQHFSFAFFNNRDGVFQAMSSTDVFGGYQKTANQGLREILSHRFIKGPEYYAAEKLRLEFNTRFSGKRLPQGAPLIPTWNEYCDRVSSVGRFLEQVDKGEPYHSLDEP